MVTLSITRRKFFASLQLAKNRRLHGLFLVEGEKALGEIAASGRIEIKAVVATACWWDHSAMAGDLPRGAECYVATAKEIGQMSGLVSAPDVVAVCAIPAYDSFDVDEAGDNLVLALDNVQDPGNLGTIVRLADWWGVGTVLCSEGTVDAFNPKVVQSTMGALGRVRVVRTGGLSGLLAEASRRGIPVYGTFMEGEDLFAAPLSPAGIIVMGNEGNGIGPQVESAVNRRLTIPSYPPGRPHVESLNVATATAIILARFRSLLLGSK